MFKGKSLYFTVFAMSSQSNISIDQKLQSIYAWLHDESKSDSTNTQVNTNIHPVQDSLVTLNGKDNEEKTKVAFCMGNKRTGVRRARDGIPHRNFFSNSIKHIGSRRQCETTL